MYPALDSIISRILDQHVGQNSAISWEDLVTEVNLYSRDRVISAKEIRDIIHDLRKCRSLICSSANGYFRPATLNEGLEFVQRVYRTPARDELTTARIQREALKEYFGGQLSLSLGSEDPGMG